MPTYLHQCTDCAHEWEDFYSVSQLPPKECPKCLKETAKRVICGSNRGVVELYGQELVDKLKGDAKKMQQEASKNENAYANLLGEDKYQALQTKMDSQKTIRRSK
jgi:putative FmdB family regulatory protein